MPRALEDTVFPWLLILAVIILDIPFIWVLFWDPHPSEWLASFRWPFLPG